MRGFIAVVLTSLVAFANATPSPRFFTGCDLSGASIPLSPTTMTSPAGQSVKYVGVRHPLCIDHVP
ncbi:MAG TPA: hypothetical protein VGO47_15235 [Chlamydiales bacterium]|nr:hypothetical protein [Chlamydiales bacterium]